MNGKISNIAEICSASRLIKKEGTDRGVEYIYVSNGVLNFTLNVSNALDITQLFYKGKNMSYISKNGVKAENLPFNNRFEGGMVYTCGLDSVGNREGYELHGNFHKTPANIESVVVDEQGVEITAIIKDTALFGQNLELKRSVSVKANSGEIKIKDVLTNKGFKSENYCLLYHINFGYPFIDNCVEIKADIKETEGRTAFAKEHIDNCLLFEENKDNTEEMCYYHTLNKGEISVINKKIGIKATITFDLNVLPRLVEWKSLASGDYALGLEPSTTKLDENFSYKKILSEEKIEYGFILSFK